VIDLDAYPVISKEKARKLCNQIYFFMVVSSAYDVKSNKTMSDKITAGKLKIVPG